MFVQERDRLFNFAHRFYEKNWQKQSKRTEMEFDLVQYTSSLNRNIQPHEAGVKLSRIGSESKLGRDVPK